MEGLSVQDRLSLLLRKDPRFSLEAYNFIFEALDYTVRLKYGDDAREANGPAGQHVTGQDLLEGIRRFALEGFGCLAATVFAEWGIRRSDDFGEIVFNLVEHGLMGKQDSDSKADFLGGYGGRPLDEVFRVRPIFEYYPERDEWKASYESVVHG